MRLYIKNDESFSGNQLFGSVSPAAASFSVRFAAGLSERLILPSVAKIDMVFYSEHYIFLQHAGLNGGGV